MTGKPQNAATDSPEGHILKGPLTIEHACRMRQWFLDALATADSLTVRIDHDAEVDLSLLQLLCSACRTAFLAGKDLRVFGDEAVSLRLNAERAGFRRKRGCRPNEELVCTWVYDGPHSDQT